MQWIKETVAGKAQQAAEPPKLNNFPPCLPFMYHSMSEVASHKKYQVVFGWAKLAIAHIMILLNFGVEIASMIGFIVNSTNFVFMPPVLVGVIHIILSLFMFFFFQYLPTYWASCGSNSGKYLIFFITHSLMVIYCLLMAVGIPYISAGLVSAILSLIWSGGVMWWVAVMHFIMMALWIVFGLIHLLSILLMARHAHTEGASIATAKTQVMALLGRKSIGL